MLFGNETQNENVQIVMSSLDLLSIHSFVKTKYVSFWNYLYLMEFLQVKPNIP
jgi:hypothetical protein